MRSNVVILSKSTYLLCILLLMVLLSTVGCNRKVSNTPPKDAGKKVEAPKDTTPPPTDTDGDEDPDDGQLKTSISFNIGFESQKIKLILSSENGSVAFEPSGIKDLKIGVANKFKVTSQVSSGDSIKLTYKWEILDGTLNVTEGDAIVATMIASPAMLTLKAFAPKGQKIFETDLILSATDIATPPSPTSVMPKDDTPPGEVNPDDEGAANEELETPTGSEPENTPALPKDAPAEDEPEDASDADEVNEGNSEKPVVDPDPVTTSPKDATRKPTFSVSPISTMGTVKLENDVWLISGLTSGDALTISAVIQGNSIDREKFHYSWDIVIKNISMGDPISDSNLNITITTEPFIITLTTTNTGTGEIVTTRIRVEANAQTVEPVTENPEPIGHSEPLAINGCEDLGHSHLYKLSGPVFMMMTKSNELEMCVGIDNPMSSNAQIEIYQIHLKRETEPADEVNRIDLVNPSAPPFASTDFEIDVENKHMLSMVTGMFSSNHQFVKSVRTGLDIPIPVNFIFNENECLTEINSDGSKIPNETDDHCLVQFSDDAFQEMDVTIRIDIDPDATIKKLDSDEAAFEFFKINGGVFATLSGSRIR